MITTTAVSPYARYGRPTVTTFPADAARIGVYFGAAMSMPLWNPPQRAPNPDVIGPRSGHIASVEPLNAPSPLPPAAFAARPRTAPRLRRAAASGSQSFDLSG